MISIGGNCKDCGNGTIKFVLCKIDHQLSAMGYNNYLNDSYYLDKKFDADKFRSLKRYKDILIKKMFNECYTKFSTDTIISKVKQLIYA